MRGIQSVNIGVKMPGLTAFALMLSLFLFCQPLVKSILAKELIYNDPVVIDGTFFTLNKGDSALFNDTVTLTGGGAYFAESDSASQFQKNIVVSDNSLLVLDLNSSATITEAATLSMESGAYGMFRIDTTVNWGKWRKLSLAGDESLFQYTTMTAFLKNLQTDLEINAGGELWLGGFVGTGVSILDYPTYFYTEDELGAKTWLKQEATRDAIGTAVQKGNVYRNTLSGSGEIFNVAFTQYERGNKKVDDVPVGEWASVFETDQTGFSGDLNVISGNIVLSGETIFGTSDSGGVTYVHGQRLTYDADEESENFGKYRIDGYGGLAFARNRVDSAGVAQWESASASAPTLNTGTLFLASGRYSPGVPVSENDRTGGARLWFDAVAANNSGGFDTDSDRNIGTVRTDSALLFDDLSVYYDGVSTLRNARAVFTLDAVACRVVSANDPGDLSTAVLIDDTNIDRLGALFEKPLVDVELEKAGAIYKISASAVSASDYARSHALGEESEKIAAEIDSVRTQLARTGTMLGIYEALYNEQEAAKVEQTFRNLGRGYGVENVFNLVSHVGSVGSPFSMGGISTAGMVGAGTTVSGAIQRGQVPEMPSEAMTAPEPEPAPIEPKGAQANTNNAKSNRFWSAPFHTTIENTGTEEQDGYRVARTGFMIGRQKQFSPEFSGGYFFLYAVPELTQSGQMEGFADRYRSTTKMKEFQFALHAEHRFSDNFLMTFQVSGGTQSVEWERIAQGALDKIYTAETTGNTLSANFYLAKAFEISEHCVVMPTVGVDSEHASVFGFRETESGAGSWTDMTNLSLANFYSPYTYDRVQYSRNMARFGASGQYVIKNGGFNAKAFYGTQIGGKDAATVPITSMNGTFCADVQGLGMGRDSLDLGTGFWLDLPEKSSVRLAANYDAILYHAAITQTLVGTVNWSF